jgi:hypothetical protein
MSDRSNAATDGLPRAIPRRRFLAVSVAGGIAGLAGCSGDSPADDTAGGGDSPDTEGSGGSEDTTSVAPDTTDEATPDSTGTPSGGGSAETTSYEPREGCTIVTATDIGLDETVTAYPIHDDPETGGIQFTYQGIDAEGQGEIRVEYPDGLTLDHYLEDGQRLNIDETTGIELTELGEPQMRIRFLRIPEEYDSRSEWEPTEVELC